MLGLHGDTAVLRHLLNMLRQKLDILRPRQDPSVFRYLFRSSPNSHGFFQSLRTIESHLIQIKQILLKSNEQRLYLGITYFLKLLKESGPPAELIKAFDEYSAAQKDRSEGSESLKNAEATTCSIILNIRMTLCIISMNRSQVRRSARL